MGGGAITLTMIESVPSKTPHTLAPKPRTLAPKPRTLAPKPRTLAPKLRTLAPKPRTLAPKFHPHRLCGISPLPDPLLAQLLLHPTGECC